MQFRRSLCATLFPAMFLLAQVSHASVDGYGLGSGRDGLLAGSFGGPVNAYAAIVAAAGAGAVSVTVGDAWAFSAGDLALIIQTTGIASIPAPGGAGPIDLAQEKLGRYELARIADVIGNSIEFTDPLINAYASAGAQVVRVPEFTDVTLDKFSRIYPPPFDGTTGGIVAFLATGTITLPTGASIDASVTGFRGGQPSGGGDDSLGCTALQLDVPTAGAKGEGPKLGVYGAGGYGETGSGGGGGDCYKAGGGGGGNIGGGGRGGVAIDTGLSVGGLGGRGLSFSPSFSRLTFGGGGGSAHADNIGGTPGGGIVFVRAASIVGGGAIRADAPPANNLPTPTGSGGGAGGTVSLRTTGTADCGVVSAAGAAGGVGGPGTLGSPGSPGGGGGGGRVVVQSSSGSCIANSTSVQGGAAVGTSGSTAGSGGLFEQRGVGYPVLPAPTIDSPADGSLINTVQPFLTGHLNGGAPADTQVAIYLSGSELMRVPVGPSGNWSTRLNIGSASHQVSARAHSLGDADVFSPAAIVQFTLDYFPPTPPVITSPGDGSLLTTATPQISGATEANAAFEVFLDGVLASTGFASGGGLFSYTTGVLSQTTHSVYATAKDLAGNKSTGATVTFTVDTIAPLAPAVTAPSAGVEIADSTPVFAGTAEPNATVSVYIDTVLQGTATAGASGDWVFTQPTPLGSTSHTLNATTTDAAGNVSGLSGTVAFSIAPVPPAPATPIVLHPSAHESFASVALTVSGTAGANLHVFIKIDDVAATDLFADVNGNWSILLPADLTEGEHTISVSAEDLYAQTSAFSSPRTFTVDLTPPERPVIIAPLVNGFVNTTSPTFAGTAEANCSVEINVDALPVGVAAVSGDGSWSDTVILGAIMNLNGTHSVNARTFDAAGNYSAAAVIAFTIDTIPPDTIAMGVPTGPITATNLSIALSSNEMSVNFECNLDNAGFVPCAATWVLTGLGVGTHTVIVRAVDQAGNVDPTPLTGTFVVDASGVVVVGPTGTTGAGGGSGATGGTSGTPNSGGTSGDSNTDGAMSDAGDANMTPGTTEQSPKKQGCSASTPANRSFMVLLMALIAARTLARRRRT